MNREQRFGQRDWRMPNRRELRSLLSLQTRLPALPEQHPFIEVFNGWYWTSTTAAISPAHAWYVALEGACMFYGGKDQSFMLWPVRGEGLGLGNARSNDSRSDLIGRIVFCEVMAHAFDVHPHPGFLWPAFLKFIQRELELSARSGHSAPES